MIKFKNRPSDRAFNNFADVLFTGMPSVFRDDFVTSNFKQFAPVNVKESENGYDLEVVAQGMNK